MTIKSRERVKKHGEVFTPDFVVEDMIHLVKNETERIESRFLEPACGDGNFLVEVLKRKLDIVKRKYRKSQYDFEKNSIIVIGSIYGVELLEDNRTVALDRLYAFFRNEYENLYKKNSNNDFLKNIQFVLSRNILQGDAVTLKNDENKLIVFSEWSLVGGSKIKRRDFQFVDLADFVHEDKTQNLFSVEEISDTGEIMYSPMPYKEYAPVNFTELYKTYE